LAYLKYLWITLTNQILIHKEIGFG
jgi:hypothetical protein